MPAAFFWFALFPMFLGGVILLVFIIFLRREGQKPDKPESRRLTPEKFIDEVALYSNVDNAEAERIIEFVFSYFPGFNWRKKLPRVRVKDMERYEDSEEKAKKS